MTSLKNAIVFYLDECSVFLSPETVRTYRTRLSKLDSYFDGFKLQRISLNYLREFRGFLVTKTIRYADHPIRSADHSPISPVTIRNILTTVKSFFRFCVSEKLLNADPSHALRLPPLPGKICRGISAQEFSALVDATTNKRDLALLLILADTAVRVGGVCSLKWDDVDLTARNAIVHEKGLQVRLIFFGQDTCGALSSLFDDYPPRHLINGPETVFLSLKKQGQLYQPLKPNSIYQICSRLAHRANVKTFNPHSFRHAAIKSWLNHGMPLNQASQLAGHSSVKITGDIYGVHNPHELAQAHLQYGLFDQKF